MALKFTKKADSSAATGVSAKALLKTFQKDLGEGVGSVGGALVHNDRLPTGIFPLDLKLGGGFPRGKVSLIFGPESSNKTNIALLAIAQHQRTYPGKVCVFVDVEHALDPEWAKALGVDMENLIVLKPAYAEQAVDLVESFLSTDDCGVVVVDSLAALITTSEAESSAEKAVVGGAALVIGKMTRRTTLALMEAEKRSSFPTLIYINQISYKIGVMFGDPETQPGGKKPLFQAAIILRCYGKNKMDPKVSSVMPVMKEVNFIIKKHKCPILGINGTFEMATMPHNGLKVGESDDFSQIKSHLELFDQFEKGEKSGWTILGTAYKTQDEFKQKLRTDHAFASEVKAAIITRLQKDNWSLDA